MTDTAPALIVVGRVRKPHGLKGELSIFPLTDQPEQVFVAGRVLSLVTLAGKAVGTATLSGVRGYHREWLLRFEGHETRDAVEGFREHFLSVPRADLPTLGEGEVYQQDLVGFAVQDGAGIPLGIVSDVYDLPAGLTIEVQGPKREFLLPFRGEYVVETDTTLRRLVVTVPEGLLD